MIHKCKVNLSDLFVQKMYVMSIHEAHEVLAYIIGYVDKDKQEYNCIDLWIPKQTVTGTSTEDDDDEQLRFMSSGVLRPPYHNVGWIHTHPKMSAFLSGTDDAQIKKFLGFSSDYGVLSLVVTGNKPFEVKNRLWKDPKLPKMLINMEIKAWISHRFWDKIYTEEVEILTDSERKLESDIDENILDGVAEEIKEKCKKYTYTTGIRYWDDEDYWNSYAYGVRYSRRGATPKTEPIILGGNAINKKIHITEDGIKIVQIGKTRYVVPPDSKVYTINGELIDNTRKPIEATRTSKCSEQDIENRSILASMDLQDMKIEELAEEYRIVVEHIVSIIDSACALKFGSEYYINSMQQMIDYYVNQNNPTFAENIAKLRSGNFLYKYALDYNTVDDLLTYGDETYQDEYYDDAELYEITKVSFPIPIQKQFEDDVDDLLDMLWSMRYNKVKGDESLE